MASFGLLLTIFFFLLRLDLSFCSGTRSRGTESSPSNPPEIWSESPRGASPPGPAFPPTHHDSFASPPNAFSPSLNTSPESQDCDGITCSEPLTLSPIGSQCACVYPIQVIIDVGIDPYVLFNVIQHLEIDVATGTFIKQSQVKIVEARASSLNQGRTTVTMNLVPLGEGFDNYTALLIYDRFREKKVVLNKTTFHDYKVIKVNYPGLPLSPPSPSDDDNRQDPIAADVPTNKTRKLNARIIVVLALTSFLLVLVCLGMVFLLFKLRKSERLHHASGPADSTVTRPENKSPVVSSMESSTSVSFVSPMTTYPPTVKTFSLAQLGKATDGFSSRRLLGEGGSSCVYHGILDDGCDVAVKLLKRFDQDREREHEFIAEVEMLSRLHHRNLVKLIGICVERNKRCLVYELVRNGSVESHLHGSDKSKGPLDWDARMKIALGAARALAYLHEDSNPRVIHRDFKASNVLLEEDLTPKVSDFGLAKEASEGNQHLSTRVMGTFGYVAPEYAMTGHLLVKSDVYSYGVVLLELLSGRKPVFLSNSQEPVNLATWARPLLGTREGLEQLLDPFLHGKCELDNVTRVAAVASMCVQSQPSNRPFMGEVVQALKLICSDKEDTCEEESNSKEESSSFGREGEFGGDFGAGSSWWSAGSPLSFSHDFSVSSVGEMQGSRSEPLSRYNSSGGPSRTKRLRKAFYRLRGSLSEHGRSIRHSNI